jgi:hypothetical protein
MVGFGIYGVVSETAEDYGHREMKGCLITKGC